MPVYTVKDPSSGKTVSLRGDSAPTQAELEQIFASINTPAEAPSQSEPKSLSGFLSNVGTSGMNAVKEMAEGVKTLAPVAVKGLRVFGGDYGAMQEMAQGSSNLIKAAPQIGSAIVTGAKNRYGSMENIKNTLYNDPVGALMDVSTLADGVGLLGKASGATKVAEIANTVSKATNPVHLAGLAMKPVLREAGLGSVLATVRPGPELREDFGGARKIGKAILDNELTSHASAKGPLDAGRKAVDDLLAFIDAQRQKVKGFLPPAREHVPMGAAPTPSGGSAELSPADVIMQMRKEAEVPGPSRANLDALVDTNQHLGAGSAALPVDRLGFDAEAQRIAATLGPQSRLAPVGPMLGEGRPARTVFEPQFLGTPKGGGVADTVAGPGVIVRDNPNLGPAGRVLKGNERGVHVDDLVREILGEPASKASRRAILGEPDLRPALQERIEALKAAYPSGDIPLSEANALKREAQDLAYESGRDNLTINKAAQKAEARALRAGIENRVPAVGPLNTKEQDLLGASRALFDAEKRDVNLQHVLSLLAGGLLGFNENPLHGLGLAGLGLATNSPAVGTRLGIGLNRTGKALASPVTADTALALRLAGKQQQ